jgi:rod shape-determining protein MreB and related proteins
MSVRDLAIDLGTANTLVYQHERGIVFNEPTVVAMNTRDGKVLAVGREAWDVAGRTPANVAASRPIQRGAIADFDVTAQMMRLVFKAIGMPRFPKPRVLVCVASVLTPVERRAVEEAVTVAGARSVSLVDEPLAAAIGAGLPIQDPVGNMVVDVGGGTSEMAMVAMGGLVTRNAIRLGGFDMDAAVQAYLRRQYDIAIGELAAERLKIELGSAYPAADAGEAEVIGRDLSTGLQRTVVVTPEEIREVLGDCVTTIVQTTRDCLSESPPELAHDVLETGIFLTGGGGMLRGLDMRMARECEVPVHLTEHPLATVVIGAGRLLDYLPEYRSAFLATHRPG